MKVPQPLLTFPDADKSPLSIRAKALVFFDPRSHQVRDEVERLAPGSQPLLIRGETGTGKELLARHIHRASERPGLFVAVSCGALSRTYAEAELFGYAPGAHNGPVGSRAGWFGSAQGGTLYLDEIADLPLALQEKLLRVLQEREVLRVGAREPIPLDVRLVVATSIDLAQAVSAGKFLPRRQPNVGCAVEAASLWLRPCRRCASGSATSCPWPNTSSACTRNASNCRCRRSARRPRRRWRATPGRATFASWKTSSTSPCWSARATKCCRNT
ncbi:Sigma-54 interaction domain-containing protein [Pseudomonas panipatensis]|nr:Sigma-54 interaction domain-containing protein [Pseudomonas panipatensis]